MCSRLAADLCPGSDPPLDTAVFSSGGQEPLLFPATAEPQPLFTASKPAAVPAVFGLSDSSAGGSPGGWGGAGWGRAGSPAQLGGGAWSDSSQPGRGYPVPASTSTNPFGVSPSAQPGLFPPHQLQGGILPGLSPLHHDNNNDLFAAAPKPFISDKPGEQI